MATTFKMPKMSKELKVKNPKALKITALKINLKPSKKTKTTVVKSVLKKFIK